MGIGKRIIIPRPVAVYRFDVSAKLLINRICNQAILNGDIRNRVCLPVVRAASEIIPWGKFDRRMIDDDIMGIV